MVAVMLTVNLQESFLNMNILSYSLQCIFTYYMEYLAEIS